MNALTTLKSKLKHKLNFVPSRAVPVVAAAVAAVATSATNSHADIAELFTAVSIAGVEDLVQAFITGLVVVGLIFFGWKLLRKMGVSI